MKREETPHNHKPKPNRLERLDTACEQLHQALVIIEEDGFAAEYDSELKLVAMKAGLDHTISPIAMIEQLAAERDELKREVSALNHNQKPQ